MYRVLFTVATLINLLLLTKSQECNPRTVEWFPHQHSCQRFILCFHGNPLERSCAPGLHFSPTELKCMLPREAECDINFMCPPEDDENNPIFIADRLDCQKYFICFNGSPIPRTCAEDLWWDAEKKWCTFEDEVTCDNRTTNNPRTRPIIEDCHRITHLFRPETDIYMKSSCIINTSLNYTTAEQDCNDRNMNLFVIDNSDVHSTFFTATTNALIMNRGGFIWINGRRENNVDWFTFSPNRAPLYSGMEWVNTSDVDGRTSGDCLRYTQEFGPFQGYGIGCNRASWYSCEFRRPPVFNSEICRNENVLRDDNGNYLKTSCIINILRSYFEAEQLCINNGMRLFVINNSTVQSAFARTTTQSLPGNNGFVWINGQRDDDSNEWYVLNPRRTLIYDGIDWVETGDINGRTSGDCLMFSSQHGPYRAMGADCLTRSWVICEY